MKCFVCLCLCFAIPVLAQTAPKSIALTDTSDISAKDILKALSKECPNVSITNDASKSDYTLDATKRKSDDKRESDEGGLWGKTFYLTLLDRDGVTFIAASDQHLGKAAKDVCHAIKTSVSVEVVDTETLTQSVDVRGNTSGGLAGAIVNSTTGRRTHTDTSKIYVIVNGEHALLDCYERRTGCTTIGPGKYYGQFDGGSIWINYQMPLTHKPLRNHYAIAGSW
ncbi:MAG TPA: hypothetical protein VIH78_09370 [Terriglobales bacterium]